MTESLRVASSRFRTTLTDELQILGARTIGKDDRPDEDMQGALSELEQSVASQIRPAEWFKYTKAGLAFFDGSYPMHNGAYLYVNRVPWQPLPARSHHVTSEFVPAAGGELHILTKEKHLLLRRSRGCDDTEAEHGTETRRLSPLRT